MVILKYTVKQHPMNYQPLFDYLYDSHGVTLTQSEMQELINIVNAMKDVRSEQVKECTNRNGEECIKPSSCHAFGCNKPM
jgi:hypothetical protein